tara:strand:+ start:422 stop:592 length:171 start_codon:yes stop_codon:yes gene_type:complete
MIHHVTTAILNKLLKKHGSIGLLTLVGDFIVSKTKTKKDDELWNDIKKLIQKHYGK